jgi:hypothetical protein
VLIGCNCVHGLLWLQPPIAAAEMARVIGTGEDAGEEDVDIDDDLAPAQFAPVEIDKDGVGADGEGSSSGDSSDSGSGSSGMCEIGCMMI